MRVTQDEIIKMNELYLEYHTYAAVAKEVGRAPSTVKRYIDPDYVSQEVCQELKEINWEALDEAPIINISTWEKDFLRKRDFLQITDTDVDAIFKEAACKKE